MSLNEKVVFEIGDLIRVKYGFFRKLSAEEIVDSYEYKRFRKRYPELCRFAEGEL